MDPNKKYKAYFSEEQFKLIKNAVIYQNKEGKEVEATTILDVNSKINFKDAIDLGEVTQFVRPGRKNYGYKNIEKEYNFRKEKEYNYGSKI